MLYYSNSNIRNHLSDLEVREAVRRAISESSFGSNLIVVPPDITRIHSRAGEITQYIWDEFGDRITDILPALGTHSPMTDSEISTMFGTLPKNLFREHRWRNDIVTLGEVPGEYINMVSEGKLNYSWPVQVNRLIDRFGRETDCVGRPGCPARSNRDGELQ